ncbi:MAG: P1 family peptidase [Candidatus Palauibacterales bacterium]|nr:P1 family peptidase [Candidatus Palauibacterales bacterium]MDP2530630.1 P1 family peptidase [Candidatus Palauibacterales bacterium]MDP2583571.1 P1 family peptidase [Candidatus Palauibacterales bacterium]
MSPNRSLTAVAGLQVGHAQDVAARTGCTVVLGPFTAVVEVRGLATGSRELDALSPLHVVPCCDALLLTGGSAFGLAAADGVVAWLEEHGRGFRTAAARVPIVPAAVLYDLAVGDASVRPGPAMGRAAVETAGPEPVEEGPVGAGCGATVGKLAGPEFAEPSGVGSAVAEGREGTVAALAAVNAFGDVVDGDGSIVAGCRAPGGGYRDTARTLRDGSAPGGFGERLGRENTTLGVVATDVPLGRTDLQVVARQAVHGLIRRLRPAATPFDGDMVFALSTGAVGERLAPRPLHELLPLALRAEEALAEAVTRAVRRT